MDYFSCFRIHIVLQNIPKNLFWSCEIRKKIALKLLLKSEFEQMLKMRDFLFLQVNLNFFLKYHGNFQLYNF